MSVNYVCICDHYGRQKKIKNNLLNIIKVPKKKNHFHNTLSKIKSYLVSDLVLYSVLIL